MNMSDIYSTPFEDEARRTHRSKGRHTRSTRETNYLDTPSRSGDLYRAAAHLGGQHARRVDLSKPLLVVGPYDHCDKVAWCRVDCGE